MIYVRPLKGIGVRDFYRNFGAGYIYIYININIYIYIYIYIKK